MIDSINISNFWQKLDRDSKSYEQAVHYPSYFKSPFCTIAEIKEVLYNWCYSDLEYVKGTSRVYINGGMSYAHSRLFYQNPPNENDTLKSYHQRIFGNQKAGIFIDQIERFHDTLAQRVAKFVQPLADQLGFPHFTCTLSLLMGNYGETPFGIHYDFLGGRTFHLILEGQKEMQSWQREEVYQITGQKNRNFYWTDKEKLMKYGQKYSLCKGDLFFLPIHTYHIGNSSEFNVDFCITIINEDNPKVVKESLRRYSHQLGEAFHSSTPESDFEHHHLSIPDPHQSITLSDLIEDYSLRLQSNGGLKYMPQLLPFTGKLKEKVLQLKNPFKLFYQVKDENLDLYVRGRIIRLYHLPSLITLFDHWNKGKIFHYTDIVNELKNDISEEDIENLLLLIYKYGGLEIVKYSLT
ncbi:MAG: hypothetical protein AAFP82_00960 [Bacteroidota bacterium]